MLHGESLGLLVGAIALGGVHGIEPGHGWPVAATYALDRSNKWLYGFAASFIIGVGHLVSSIAMVAVFFSAKAYFDLTQVNEPIEVVGGLQVGGPVSLVAGVLLIALGIREYHHGHSHGHGGDGEGHGHGNAHDGDEHAHAGDSAATHVHDQAGDDRAHDEHANEDDGHDYHVLNGGHVHGEGDHDHSHDDGHSHDHSHEHTSEDDHSHEHTSEDDHSHGGNSAESDGLLARLAGALPFVGGHSHAHGMDEGTADRGLLGIAWFAFVLGFAHEEEFEIIALCAGSTHCLELMLAYALAVIVGIVGLTMLLIAGYQRYEERVERYTPYLPAFSAAVLIIMGLGFISGLL
jgi:nickel/cobalt exporter